ncbi:hypothetical protein LQF61_02540 [Tetragenococcus koreensis]|uniref:hypothetical protein n=1 Tax=Tetragenococcus koreensis TaxID=290335 RepID=UPI001929FFFF|nr:hypothetical protein [Tetragenococcus koreensis]MCF1616237.1 hypothetical protein [Tetragenococcus koreensis]MCF1618955.1 hypothetical protein [Tetragenococcus koreensis]MCF1656457.1 hypothetical protein [Tetragenococcus koreensis]MCF1677096.1 hypothetical protein [Tetragenococcus koreensis]MCF1686545.1 hypothetical protein [Tetragenococcus koreensis]
MDKFKNSQLISLNGKSVRWWKEYLLVKEEGATKAMGINQRGRESSKNIRLKPSFRE